MAALQEAYIVRIKTIQPQLKSLQAGISDTVVLPQAREQLNRLSHNLAGSGATFGFPDISATARVLHNLLKASEADGLGKDIIPAIERLGAALEAAVSQPAVVSGAGLSLPAAPRLAIDEGVHDVFFIGSEAAVAEKFAGFVRQLGYRVHTDKTTADIQDAFSRGHVKSLVLFGDLNPAELDMVRNIRGKKGEAALPLIVVSPFDDFEMRLSAVRAGAMAFLKDDVDPIALADKIESVTQRLEVPPKFNVLIVDDDDMLSEFYRQTLGRVGLSVQTLSDPKETLHVLAETQVDILLVDYSMPGCNGRELASVLRQDERYLTLPMIFISSHDEIESLLLDARLGIDDFLLKPFSALQLESMLISRARRAADLGDLMIRDSFTGLLNHSRFHEELRMEIYRAARQKHESVYVSLDLDHFKKINDTYGHSVGDHVIKSMARMLQQSLRRTDIIGRCGGEEFGIIMPITPFENAKEALEKLRKKFSETRYTVDGREIGATFSAGITRLTGDSDFEVVLKIADEALYEAKAKGRNQIRAGGA